MPYRIPAHHVRAVKHLTPQQRGPAALKRALQDEAFHTHFLHLHSQHPGTDSIRFTQGGSVFDFIKRGVNTIKDKFNDKFAPHYDRYTNASQRTLGTYGNRKIVGLSIVRAPIQSFLKTALNALSSNKFGELMKKYGFDQMYHLQLIVDVQGDTPGSVKRLVVEKNQTINISAGYSAKANAEYMPVATPSNLTLAQFLNNAQKGLGDSKYFLYDPFNRGSATNCQGYIQALLKYNNLLTTQNNNFLFQDVSELVKELPKSASWTARALTDIGATVDRVFGRGIPHEQIYRQVHHELKLLGLTKKKFKGGIAALPWQQQYLSLKQGASIYAMEGKITIQEMADLINSIIITPAEVYDSLAAIARTGPGQPEMWNDMSDQISYDNWMAEEHPLEKADLWQQALDENYQAITSIIDAYAGKNQSNIQKAILTGLKVANAVSDMKKLMTPVGAIEAALGLVGNFKSYLEQDHFPAVSYDQLDQNTAEMTAMLGPGLGNIAALAMTAANKMLGIKTAAETNDPATRALVKLAYDNGSFLVRTFKEQIIKERNEYDSAEYKKRRADYHTGVDAQKRANDNWVKRKSAYRTAVPYVNQLTEADLKSRGVDMSTLPPGWHHISFEEWERSLPEMHGQNYVPGTASIVGAGRKRR